MSWGWDDQTEREKLFTKIMEDIIRFMELTEIDSQRMLELLADGLSFGREES